jgi:hypothetical protein
MRKHPTKDLFQVPWHSKEGGIHTIHIHIHNQQLVALPTLSLHKTFKQFLGSQGMRGP